MTIMLVITSFAQKSKIEKSNPEAFRGKIEMQGVQMFLPGGWQVYTVWATAGNENRSFVSKDTTFFGILSRLGASEYILVQGIELDALLDFSEFTYKAYVKDGKNKNPIGLKAWLNLGTKKFFQMNGYKLVGEIEQPKQLATDSAEIQNLNKIREELKVEKERAEKKVERQISIETTKVEKKEQPKKVVKKLAPGKVEKGRPTIRP